VSFKVFGLVSGDDHDFCEMELFGLLDFLLVLEDDLSGGWKGEVVFLVARAAEPEVFDDLPLVFAGDDSDDASVAEVVELSSAVWIEATIDHRTLPLNLVRCIGGFEGRPREPGMQVAGDPEWRLEFQLRNV
jgi:hypothetical protein